LRALFDASLLQKSGQKCKSCSIVESLDADDRLVLEEAFSNPDMSTQMILNVLKQAGFFLSLSALARHRRECR
jgi:hypothetical protein